MHKISCCLGCAPQGNSDYFYHIETDLLWASLFTNLRNNVKPWDVKLAHSTYTLLNNVYLVWQLALGSALLEEAMNHSCLPASSDTVCRMCRLFDIKST